MRQVLFVIVLACSLCLMVQCSGIESLSDFDGKLEMVVSPATKAYTYLPYLYSFQSDSLKWIYDCTPGRESRVSIVVSGKILTDSLVLDENDGSILDTISIEIDQNHLDLGIEIYNDLTPSVVQVKASPDGTVLDTVLIGSSPISELILPQSSRLFVAVDIFVSDTILLPNPHSIK